MKTEAKVYRKQIGKNIRSIRGMLGYTQKHVAAHLKMSITNFSNIENGFTSINTFRLNQLAVLFKLKENDIIQFHVHPIFQPKVNK